MKPHQILLYDMIFDGEARRARDELVAAGKKPVELRINSPGGNVFEGYAIYNALLGHAAGVTVFVDGIAASMASYIAMAGQPIIMAENAMLMIHNPTTGTSGDAEDMRKLADLLDKVTTSIVDAYARRTKQPPERIREMMDEETWLTAEMALEMGFVDQVAEPMKAAAFDMSRFRHPPSNLIMKDLISAEALAELQSTLTAQTAAITGLTSDMAAQKALNAAVAVDRDGLKTQVTDLTTENDALKVQVSDRDTKITGLTGERDKATKEVTFLEGFCKAHGLDLAGVDRTKAVTEVVEGSGPADGEALIAKLDAIKDTGAATTFYRENKAAIDAAYKARK